ncbi:MAG: bifunctional glutamate N-acetyltransferase/amino-acid acetyltransferase ArgJ [Nitriliruptoraceae bacterium]
MIAGWGPDDTSGLREVAGGVTAASGFRAGGTVSGVKASGRPDLALLVSDVDASAAAMITTNRVQAPSCVLTRQHAADGRARAVVVNSGNANVCTPDAAADNDAIVDATARALGIERTNVLAMSTGVIGVPLPVDLIVAALPGLVEGLVADGGPDAARAILTTDTTDKQCAVEVMGPDGARHTVGGMAKGVGMIEPSMATMLAILTTDAELNPTEVDDVLRRAVDQTFNRISVDGDRSTSDTAVLLANGAAGRPADLDLFARAVHHVCSRLAHAIVRDGEGASRVAAVGVRGAMDDADAERLARTVATSLLVRAAVHGADPNWGRILMALGNAGVDLDPDRVRVACAGTVVCDAGVAVAFDRAAVACAMASDEVQITIDVGTGPGAATVLTCDLTPEYVRFNAEYTT